MKLFYLIPFLCSLTSSATALHVSQGLVQKSDSATTTTHRQSVDPFREAARPRYRTQGYRIQVFTGGNDRAAKRAAQDMKTKVQRHFPELSVYIHFQSPRWVCRVGDFLTREEAQHYVKQIRKKRLSPEAAIVKSQILRAY